MSDQHLELMGGDTISVGSGSGSPSPSPSLTGKISPVNIPPAVQEEDITSPTGEEEQRATPAPAAAAVFSIRRRMQSEDDDQEDTDAGGHEQGSSLDVEFLKRVLLGKDISPPKNRRTYSCEQSSGHLWANSPSRVVRMNPRKRTSAPQFGRTNTIRNTIVLRSRRSWPVAPPRIRRYYKLFSALQMISSVHFQQLCKSRTPIQHGTKMQVDNTAQVDFE